VPKVKANGISIRYEERGKGEPLVLIMGLGADGSLWEDHVQEYEQYFRWGISMGGAIAQELVLRHPEKVRSMVLISAWAACNEFARTLLEHFKKMRVVSTPADFIELLQLWIYSPGYMQDHIKELKEGQQEAAANWMPQHAFEAQCDACSTHNTLDRLNQIKVPTLITVGDADIFTPLAFSQAIHERIEGSKMLVFEEYAHVHHWEDLDRFNQESCRFVRQH
jgi:pimeloyl-ACP methyl ester carboxylesterase